MSWSRVLSGLPCVLLLATGSACDDEPVEPQRSLCTPLGTTPATGVELEGLLGAGRDAAGTLYVVDEAAGGEVRVFVGDESGLERQVVAGSGEGTLDGGGWTVATLAEMNLLIKVTITDDGTVQMGVRDATDGARDFTIGQEGEKLEVLDASAVDSLPLTDLPGEVFVEYWVQSADGQLLLVTRPTYDWEYDDFRVFFGPPERVEECVVEEVQRLRDGGTTIIAFAIDGAQATATFPTPLGDDEPTLELGGETLALEDAEPDPQEGAEFFCL